MVALQEELALMPFQPVKGIDMSKPMHPRGVDSLVVVELRKWSSKTLQDAILVFETHLGHSGLGRCEVVLRGKLGYGKNRL